MLALIVDLLNFAAAALLFLVLVFLLRGPFQRFIPLLIYVIWEFLATLGLTIADRLYNGSSNYTPNASSGQAQQVYDHLYWTNDVIVDLLRFLLVIVFTYQAIGPSPARAPLGRLLGGVVVVVVVLPFLLFHPHFTPWPQNAWFYSNGEFLSFGAAIMNLVLWGTLIASKQRDPQLLTVSSGLGVVVTGEAIAYGMRHFTPVGSVRMLPSIFLILTQIAGWMIWCRAFWPSKNPKPALSAPSVS